MKFIFNAVFILANSTKICYTYDSLSRVIAKTVKNISDDSVISTETFTYDAAGNVTSAPDSCFRYDTNNRLVIFNENTVSYDLDGNMLDNGDQCFVYDSANRLIGVDDHIYTYNAENVRIRKFCTDEDTVYTYDTNCKLSKLLCKTTNGITTKYVYGRGLIGEEVSNSFKTYHFDCRGSTIAITDASGNITDTFLYNTYGKLINRTGTSAIIFGYNGRDGVVTDDNGLIYMRARYYSPDMRRFVNADIVAGQISNAVTLNRFAYANGNPVSFVDPFGLWSLKGAWNRFTNWVSDTANDVKDWAVDTANDVKDWAVDTANNVKDWAVDTYNDAKETVKDAATWVDTNVIKPAGEAATAVGDWFEEAGEWLNENARNKDGSYALHDNQRFDKDAVFHEQILAFTPSGPSFDLRNGNIGLGALEVDALTGGWEGEHANLSLLDFGHAEVGAEIKNGDIKYGALASIWSPSFSFSIGKLSVDIGAEVGAVGAGFKKVNHGFSLFGAYGFGGSLTFSLNN